MLLGFGLMGLANATIIAFNADDGSLKIRVDTRSECKDPVKSLIGALNAPKNLEWAEAQVTYNGTKLEACAAPVPGPNDMPAILIIDQDGDGGVIPAQNFHAVKEL